MPIRFRCVYCNQLLGISRRKAGTVVRCTTCGGQLIVPDPNDPVTTEPAGTRDHEAVAAPPPAKAEAGSLLEQSDFDAILEPQGAAPPSAAVASRPATPSAVKSRRSAAVQASASAPPTLADGSPALVLSRQWVTIGSVLLVLCLGLSFACGLLLGLSLR
jgi:hypothetical protein